MVQHQKIRQSDALDGGEAGGRGGAGRSAEEAGLPFAPHLWAGGSHKPKAAFDLDAGQGSALFLVHMAWQQCLEQQQF